MMAGAGRLELKMVVAGSDVMQALANHVGRDPRAREAGISVGEDIWRAEDTGRQSLDWYLKAADSHVLVAYLSELGERDPTLAPREGHELVFEWVEPYAGVERIDPYWRTYYLDSTVHLGSLDVAAAEVAWSQYTNQPEVLITFTPEGGQRFGDLTKAHVGDKLAIMVNGVISSAPVIQSAIYGGRSTITMGGTDSQQHAVGGGGPGRCPPGGRAAGRASPRAPRLPAAPCVGDPPGVGARDVQSVRRPARAGRVGGSADGSVCRR